MDVQEDLAELMNTCARVTELLSKSSLSQEEMTVLQRDVDGFSGRLKAICEVLSARIGQIRDDVPLRNNSFKEREELEVSMLKARHLLEILSKQ